MFFFNVTSVCFYLCFFLFYFEKHYKDIIIICLVNMKQQLAAS